MPSLAAACSKQRAGDPLIAHRRLACRCWIGAGWPQHDPPARSMHCIAQHLTARATLKSSTAQL